MRNPISRLIRDLSGGSQQRFVQLLAGQIDATVYGARIVRDLVDGRDGPVPPRELIREAEHDGDRQRAGLISALGYALVTPIDREDLFRVSRAIDDVLDNLRDFTLEWELYRMEPSPLFQPLLDGLIEATTLLREGTQSLVGQPSTVGSHALAAKKAANQVRRLYQRGLAEIFNTPDDLVTATTLKNRELLRRLDIVALRIRQAADVLSDAAVKRSH